MPLFVEELTKSVLESGLLREEDGSLRARRPLAAARDPDEFACLSDGAARPAWRRCEQVAQIGAAIGREFRYTLLRAVSGLPEDELQAALARLVASGLVFQRGTPPDAIYTFKHALVQEAAYGSLLRGCAAAIARADRRSARDSFPRDDGRASPSSSRGITSKPGSLKNPSSIGARPVGGPLPARQWRKRLRNFKRDWTSWSCCRTISQRQRQELEFRSSLGAVIAIRQRLGGAGNRPSACPRPRAVGAAGFSSEFVQVPYAQSLHHSNRGEFDLAQRLDEDLLRLSRQRNDSAGLFLGHLSAGRTLMFAGRFAACPIASGRGACAL